MKNKFPTKEIIDLINTGTTEKKKENDEKNAGKTQTQDQSGFGAEIGISTQKLHARGPMGLNALTTTKYIIYGNGQVRA